MWVIDVRIAAYLLDHEHFAGVPATVLVRVTHPIFHEAVPVFGEHSTPSAAPSKLGSLQVSLRR